MRNTLSLLVLILLAVVPSGVLSQVESGHAGQPDVRLAYDLIQGDTYQLEIHLRQTTSSESFDAEEISLFSQMELVFRVDSVVPAGNIHLKVSYRDQLLSMLAPGLGIDINSGTSKNPLLTAMLDTLQSGSFQVIMAPSGELLSMDGLQELFKILEKIPAEDSTEHQVILNTMDEVYGPNAFESIFGLLVSVYPVVQPIQNWTRDILYYFNTKPVHMSNRYFLSRTTEEVVTIQGLGMLSSSEEFQESTSMGSVRSKVSGSQTFDFQMDPRSGWLKKCHSKQRVLIETTIVESSYLPPGLKIPSYTETVFEVKGNKIN